MGKHTVAVAGATGYAGGEMLRILAAHPDFEVTTVAGHSSVGQPLGAFQPHIPQLAHLIVEDTTPEALNGHDVIVLALPHGASGALAAQLDDDAVIVDLGADHRLEQQQAWDDYYGGAFYEHWVYGMPELILGKDANGAYRRQHERLLGAKRIAGPGCNVTAVTLAMQPGIANNLVVPHTIVADLAVGYSGAGKNLKRTNLLASEALNSAVPYAVGGTHRHIPEILQNFAHAAGLDAAAADEFTLAFTPMLVPMSRGILASVSAKLTDAAMDLTDEQIHAIWTGAYEGQGFVSVLAPGAMPATQNVLGSNAAHVQVAVDRRSRTLHALAAIDNLNRGTAGQAVESLNLAFGLNEENGLTKIGVAP
ncbi:N-acetyl-gamma-glutamyl-phosphate reductase [Bifidobacterium pseudolongum subsp. globosum]|uniref:N-acetyl-gamma-glutamyl-phosphate reductase n=1 Tax=Bifidobacterium pseudolongum subsp. globosum TaxID=1690 RepID=A0A2N3R897_9BIFI|nr:N-acetyl-gamma-glutamyl-phosphate reductase [Bifidobacterium pseudolongum]PKU91316.1 N-acetyl-gamma-glutamyl-phosphate reductase [Bifidobacterium pseudolongum subsp. globosum]PKV05576.1 N-acetyl-gamma-glutamyl-phosphate reductase [Bifidobacterium pseudolongum subsp. globosum]